MVGSAAFAAGAIIGIRHALETDHLAAVATLVDEDTDRPSFVGASWGIGHSLPIAVLGLLFVALGIQLPETVTRLFEVLVGIILIYLGGRMLWRLTEGVRSHSHDHHYGHSQDHGHDHSHTERHDHDHHHDNRPHKHLDVGKFSVGLTHTHLDEESFLVGILHGFAGSGALVIALVSAAPTVSSALSFLLTFSLLSILTMAVVSTVWGRTLDTSFTTYLQGFAGCLGIGIGLLLLIEQVVGVGIF